MKTLTNIVNEWKANKDNSSSIGKHNGKFRVTSFEELCGIAYDRYFKSNTNHLDFTDIDVSQIKSFGEKNEQTDKWGLFAAFTEAITIDITGWDISNCTDISNMFWQCKSLKNIIGIEDLDISNVTDMSSMFDGCKQLDIDIRNWEVNPDCKMDWMFDDCNKMKNKIPDWYISFEERNPR